MRLGTSREGIVEEEVEGFAEQTGYEVQGAEWRNQARYLLLRRQERLTLSGDG